MLILSRRTGERVTCRCSCGAETQLEIIDNHSGVNGRAVRLGFCAPQSVRIYRNELLEDNDRDDGDRAE
jgi:carbon storage regulator CsrA